MYTITSLKNQIFINRYRSATQAGVAMTLTLLAYIGIAGSGNAAPLVQAHRGAPMVAPENTIASINAAAGIADSVEFDVRLTADGELVLMHDSTLDRTTNGSGNLASHLLSDLKDLDAGSWFSPEFAGEKIPTLSEALSASLSVGLAPLVERKSGSAAAYHSAFIAQGLAFDDFRVISFDLKFLNALDALDTGYDLGALGFGELTQGVIDNALAKGADFLHWGNKGIDQAAVDLAHSNGIELHIHTVNDEERIQELIGFGVDGILTDNPALLTSLLSEPNVPNSPTIPEPSALGLFGVGAVLLMLARGRRAGTSS